MNSNSAEKAIMAAMGTSDEVRDEFRNSLVPLAFQVYRELLQDPDSKVRHAAADSIMKIEGSLQRVSGSGTGQSGGTVVNFDFSKLQDMSQGLERVAEAIPSTGFPSKEN